MHYVQHKNCTLIYSGFCDVCTQVLYLGHTYKINISNLLDREWWKNKRVNSFVGAISFWFRQYDRRLIFFFGVVVVSNFRVWLFLFNTIFVNRFDVMCRCVRQIKWIYFIANFSAKAKWQTFNQFGRLFRFQFLTFLFSK